jgi:hypothetical protein
MSKIVLQLAGGEVDHGHSVLAQRLAASAAAASRITLAQIARVLDDSICRRFFLEPSQALHRR